jgi:hypothetical protein
MNGREKAQEARMRGTEPKALASGSWTARLWTLDYKLLTYGLRTSEARNDTDGLGGK